MSVADLLPFPPVYPVPTYPFYPRGTLTPLIGGA
jgi:hypothetical protein